MKKLPFVFVCVYLIGLNLFAQVAREKVVIEYFAGVNNPFCPAAANGINDMIAAGLQVAPIAYHTTAFSLPQFYTPETNARASYYSFSGYPTAFFDGVLSQVGGGNSGQTTFPDYLNRYNQRINVPSQFSISLTYENIGGDEYEATVVIEKMVATTYTNLVLQLILTESHIPYNWYGMTELNWVTRDMIPNQNGTPLDFSSSNIVELTLPFTFSSQWVKENCDLIAFVQNNQGKEIMQAQTLSLSEPNVFIIHEDFESYNAGQKLVEQAYAQGKEYWVTWSGNVGDIEDALVSTDYSTSGSNSVRISSDNDIVLLLGDKESGAFSLEFNTLIPNGHVGYFSLLQHFEGAQSEWGMQTYFEMGGLGNVDAGGLGTGVFNFSYNTWIPIKIDIDLNNDFAELFINGNSIVTWVWSSGTFGIGSYNQLAALNLYAWNYGGTPLTYYDDISFTEIGSTMLPPPQNLHADLVNMNDVLLTWEGPTSVCDWYHWDSGENMDGIGLTEGGTFHAAARWLPSQLTPINGHHIDLVKIFPRTTTGILTLNIAQGPNASNVVYSEALTSLTFNEWNIISLIVPVQIDASQELWVGYEIANHAAGEYPVGYDSGPAVAGFGDMISFDGVTWDPLSSFGLDYNWNIQICVSVPGDGPVAQPIAINHAVNTDPDPKLVVGNLKPGGFAGYSKAMDDVLGYKIYRNDLVIAEVQETSFLDAELLPGIYEYYVTAIYSEGESLGSNTVVVEIEDQTTGFFQPVWTSPFNPMTFYILAADIDEIPMQAGSEIGLFDIDPITGEEICVGAGKLVEPLGGGIYLEMIASMDDGSNPDHANGFTPGNPIIYKLWNNEIGELSNVIANYPYPGYDESYAALGSAFVELSGLTVITQQISLQEGWNMMSFRVMPENWDMMHIVQPLIDQGLLFKVLDEAGGSIFHLPFPPPNGQWSNTIGDMANTEGYYIKVNDNAMIELEGYPVEVPLDIPLINGWNMISYPCENEQDAMAVVQPLIDAGLLFKVIDEAGGSIFHLPFPPPNGQWSNTIGNFQSGKGYYLKSNDYALFSISCDYDFLVTPSPDHHLRQTEHFLPVWQNNPFMPMHIALYPSEFMIEGDEIGIFDGDICVGAAIFNGNYEAPMIIVASANDATSEMKDGFIPGNEITLMKNGESTNNLPRKIGFQILFGEDSFRQLETLIARVDAIIGEFDPNEQIISLADVFPNPSRNHINLSLTLRTSCELRISIQDMHGRNYRTFENIQLPTGNQVIDLDIKGLNPALYFLKIETVSPVNQTRIIKVIVG